MTSQFSPGDALLIVDIQNDFCPGGALGIPEGDRVIPILNEWIDAAQRDGIPIIASRDWHPPNHISFKDRGGPWPAHCVQDTYGAAFHESLQLPNDVHVISKAHHSEHESYSAFGDTDLAEYLHSIGIKRLWIGGLAQDYCVLQSCLDAIKHGFAVHVIVDATRAINADPGDGERALKQIRESGGVLKETFR